MHSTSSEIRRGVECVCALYSDLRGGGHPMKQVSALSYQTPLVPILRGMDSLIGHGRDRTIGRLRAQRASYHCATRAR
ncbi:hypothetical protein Y032_0048g1571 [Ancylostoma ceylanicum]|uniref:Uncharacterized protein n=1 Tax=Ancylostoma ceylanicum TaxID=53326 RepID=A0A016UBR9_9BILA|nr:hypothetical protein Y032_0048g1571 [Ancylostoma ceylanicum]